MTSDIVSVGVCGHEGLAVSLHLEAPPGGIEPDRLAVEVRIPLATLWKFLPPTGSEAGKPTARYRKDNAVARFGRNLKMLRRDLAYARRINWIAVKAEAERRRETY